VRYIITGRATDIAGGWYEIQLKQFKINTVDYFFRSMNSSNTRRKWKTNTGKLHDLLHESESTPAIFEFLEFIPWRYPRFRTRNSNFSLLRSKQDILRI